MEYKQTLNLPQTSFSMRANSANREPELQAFWNSNDIYNKNLQSRTGTPFILHDGPPYLSSDKIHIGHAMNRILKDIVVKYKTLNNHPSPMIFGYDCHGLPIEHEVTKKKKLKGSQSPLEVRQACKEFALENLKGQKENFYRLGLMGNWETEYLTLNPEYEAAQLRVFAEMVDKGYIYKGLKPVYWSIAARTALAEAEVEYKDHTSHSIYVKMPLPKAEYEKLPTRIQEYVRNKNVYFVIWTTTPWTLPANLAISLNPDFDYSFIETDSSEVLIVAQKLQQSFSETTGQSVLNHAIPVDMNPVKGHELENLKCKHPFYERDSLIILGHHVTSEAGTGCVHTAPGHGMDDYVVGQKYHLDILSPVDEAGVFTAEAPMFEGIYYEKANPIVIELLKEKNLLLHHSTFVHSYPHCWRTKTPVIYRATKQWFASLDGFREDALKAVKNTKWIPASGEERIGNMIAERSDWCISRQRVWGVPIPAFYCNDTGDALLRKDLILHVADLVEKEGSNIWWEKSAKELLPDDFTYEKSSTQEFSKETDIMDVWFDSGTSHTAVLKQYQELSYPADLYLEGSDQHRGWFQSSLLTAIATDNTAPYKTVLTHGFTLDGDGKKMSKSLGNMVEPQKVIQQYGVDVLRLWVASVDYTSDVKVSYDIFKQLSDVYRKIRNTVRFLESNLYDFDPKQDGLALENLSELDRYTLHKLQDVVSQVHESFDSYAFYRFYQIVQNFCVIDLSNIYFAIAKDILYIEAPKSHLRRSVQTVLWEVLKALIGMIAPVLSHMSEDAVQNLPENLKKELPESALLMDFPTVNQSWKNPELAQIWDKVLELRDTLNLALEEARSKKLIGRSMEANVSVFHSDDTLRAYLREHADLFRQVLIVAKLNICDSAPTEGQITRQQKDCAVSVSVSQGNKCERCWIVEDSVGTSTEHPGLCTRCENIVLSLDLEDAKIS